MTDRFPASPLVSRIVLVGAGHAHLVAIPLIRKALPDVDMILVDPASVATYSGMLPGTIAGHYQPEEAEIDLVSFASRHRVEFRQRGANGITGMQVRLSASDDTVKGNVISLDIGSHSALSEIDGFHKHAIPVKPLGPFQDRIEVFLRDAPVGAGVAVIGGGVAGTEVALALAHRHSGPVSIIEAGQDIASGTGLATRRSLRKALARKKITLFLNRRVKSVTARDVTLDDGTRVAVDLVIGAAGAKAYNWLASDLPTNAAGFIRVGPELQVEAHQNIFAVGDCAEMIHSPRPKAGVYAVRQGPVLAGNIVASIMGKPLIQYQPQDDYLKLITLGHREAVGEWHGLGLQSPLLWWLKDWIDRGFIGRLSR